MSPDRIVLVYDADSGLRALLIDVLKKATGREDCTLCAIAYGPLGKRRAWRDCEQRLGVPVDELHRDEVPNDWGLARTALPCILGRVRDGRPFVLVSRDEIASCAGRVDALERLLATSFSRI